MRFQIEFELDEDDAIARHLVEKWTHPIRVARSLTDWEYKEIG